MHTYHATRETVFNFNSDFRGELMITHGDKEISIPATDILEFVALNYVLPSLTTKLEQANWMELLTAFR